VRAKDSDARTRTVTGRRHRVLAVALGSITIGGVIAALVLKDNVITLGQSMLYTASGGTLIGMQTTPTPTTIAIMTALALITYAAAKTIADGVYSLWKEEATAGETATATSACVIGISVLAVTLPPMPSLATSAGIGTAIVALLILWTCLLRPDIGDRMSLVPLTRRSAAARGSLHASSDGMASPREIRDSNGMKKKPGTTEDMPDWQRILEITEQEELHDAGDTHDRDNGNQPATAPGHDVQPPMVDSDRVPQE